MFSQLFKRSLLNKQFYIEQYGTSSQHALQLENIFFIKIFTGLIYAAAVVTVS